MLYGGNVVFELQKSLPDLVAQYRERSKLFDRVKITTSNIEESKQNKPCQGHRLVLAKRETIDHV